MGGWSVGATLGFDFMQKIASSRDIIIRTESFDEAVRFYEQTLGFAVASRSEGLVGFETGSIRLYVEKGKAHGPVFDFLVADVPLARDSLLKAGCALIEEDPA